MTTIVTKLKYIFVTINGYKRDTKFMSRVMTYLSKDEHARFKEICVKEACTPYMLIKKAVLDHIWAYPLEKPAPSENGEQKGDLKTLSETPEHEAPEMRPEEVEERVKRILKGEVE